ncbi:Uncharacterized protein TCM_039708 [Theobroma cacao]|uniref:Uncharacterized protein n=1 Tax=Theobroma cacao TaxID=3641 RepID=A0A061GSP0_THECC|nr:Uncharacterized protein TCM_039708 [Theobroma cacao]
MSKFTNHLVREELKPHHCINRGAVENLIALTMRRKYKFENLKRLYSLVRNKINPWTRFHIITSGSPAPPDPTCHSSLNDVGRHWRNQAFSTVNIIGGLATYISQTMAPIMSSSLLTTQGFSS